MFKRMKYFDYLRKKNPAAKTNLDLTVTFTIKINYHQTEVILPNSFIATKLKRYLIFCIILQIADFMADTLEKGIIFVLKQLINVKSNISFNIINPNAIVKLFAYKVVIIKVIIFIAIASILKNITIIQIRFISLVKIPRIWGLVGSS